MSKLSTDDRVVDPVDSEEPGIPPPGQWNLATRVLFRFFFLLCGDFLWQMLGVIATHPPETRVPWSSSLVRPVVDVVAKHILHVRVPGYQGDDSTFEWVLLLCWVFLAAVGTLVWSLLDQQRPNYARLHAWLRVVVRFLLAAEMFGYGMSKVFDQQMPFLLSRLVEPFGDMSAEGALWSQISISHPYQTLLGCAEVLAGLLLLSQRTTTVGSLLCAVDMAQVFVLNVTFDVRLKMMSASFLVLCVFLLAPQLRRLAKALLSDEAVGAVAQRPLFRTPRANRVATTVQILACVLVLLAVTGGFWKSATKPKPPLYGIWNVTAYSSDGVTRPALLTDTLRWRRVIFDTPFHVAEPVTMTVQGMDDSLTEYGGNVDTGRHRIDLTDWVQLGSFRETPASITFAYQRSAQDTMVIKGEFLGHEVRASLQRADVKSFRVARNDVHWVNNQADNR
nr:MULTISPECIES: DoxX family protein [Streptomyces]